MLEINRILPSNCSGKVFGNLEFDNVKWSFKIENKMKTFSGKQDPESLLCQRPSVKELLMTHLRKKKT